MKLNIYKYIKCKFVKKIYIFVKKNKNLLKKYKNNYKINGLKGVSLIYIRRGLLFSCFLKQVKFH